MSHRAEKLADTIRDVIARAVREEIRDPQVGFVTITRVLVSPDLRQARVFVSRLGDANERARAVAALHRARTFLRRSLARDAAFRRVPELEFLEDPSVEEGSRLEGLLDDLKRERATRDEVSGSDETVEP